MSAGTNRIRTYIHEAGCALVARTPAELNQIVRAVELSGKPITPIAPTVAICTVEPGAIAAILDGEGIEVAGAYAIKAAPADPQLDWQEIKAVGPGAIRDGLNLAIEEGRQVELHYFASSHDGAATVRVLDPWTLTGNLLTGYCHLRNDERSFALERIGTAIVLTTPITHKASD